MAEPTRNRLQGLKVAVTGASGNVGTALLRRLTAPGSGVAEVRGLVRRQPPSIAPYDGVRWHLADLGETRSKHELTHFLDGVDACPLHVLVGDLELGGHGFGRTGGLHGRPVVPSHSSDVVSGVHDRTLGVWALCERRVQVYVAA